MIFIFSPSLSTEKGDKNRWKSCSHAKYIQREIFE
nr:MAG TPA: hypothetical protein [Caudoviricetes sp.]